MSLPVDGMRRRQRIPEATIKRLPVYLRVLERLQEEEVAIISSAELARKSGITSEQIRKDLAYFGAFGTRGVGYGVASLARRLRSILGLDRPMGAVLVGAGHLGTALARYNRTRRQSVQVVAIFDQDPGKVGQVIEDLTVQPLEGLEETIAATGACLAILAVPGPAAQKVAQRLVQAGIEGILNFSPVQLKVPSGVQVQQIDLSLELESLAYYAGQGRHRVQEG
ncbi:MAG: redox-sensing transcriptional repressor Rex [Bacillota bacterium]|nr:redox-sensing transcriptional repressor Rex [Bacillota bacterium]